MELLTGGAAGDQLGGGQEAAFEYKRGRHEPQGMAPNGDYCRPPGARNPLRPEPKELRDSGLDLDSLHLGNTAQATREIDLKGQDAS